MESVVVDMVAVICFHGLVSIGDIEYYHLRFIIDENNSALQDNVKIPDPNYINSSPHNQEFVIEYTVSNEGYQAQILHCI